MATGAMPTNVARQLGRQPRGASRQRGWGIVLAIGFVLLATAVFAYVLFRSQSPGVREAITSYATKAMTSATQDGYSTPTKTEVKTPTAAVDTSAAEERRKLLAALEEMRKRLEALEKRKTSTTAAAQPTPKPEKRPAPMLYLNRDLQDKVAPVVEDRRPLYALAPWATYLPCVIQPLINSDVPGAFTAKVTANVRDTRTGVHILVPQGATLGGRDQGEALLYGNQRLPTIALALTIEHRTYDLGTVPFTDQQGTNGLTGDVNNHWWRLFGAIFIGGALRGGQQMLQMEMAQAGGAGQVASGIAMLGNQASTQRIGRALDTRPTIDVFPGQVCQVLLTKELQLPAMWARR